MGVLTIEQYIKGLENASVHEDQIILMAQGLIDLFSFKDVYLFRFSPIGYLSDGVFYIDKDGQITTLKGVQDDLRSLPNILSAIHKREAVYLPNESYISRSPNFPHSSLASSVIVVPFCLSSIVIGYALTFNYENNDDIQNLLSDLTFYGKRIGKVFEKEYNYYPITKLSKREVEVMQQLAFGYSVKEMADIMGISEHTVTDYIRSAIKKTRAQNRLHAVVILFRKGIIT